MIDWDESTFILVGQSLVDALFIVNKANTGYVEAHPETKAILEQALGQDYELVRNIRGALVDKRKADRLSEARPAPPLEVRAPGAPPRSARGQPG